MLNRIKSELLNFGLKFISVDEKIVRMFLETSPSNVNEIVILPAIKNVAKKIVQKLKNKISHGRVYNGFLNGVRVSVIRSQIGCPNVAILMESLKRCKTKAVLRVDVCGGIPDQFNQINIGDIIIPSKIYCDDGVTPHYIRMNPSLLNFMENVDNPFGTINNLSIVNKTIPIVKPNEDIKNILLNKARTIIGSSRVKECALWTTDALFCEDFEFIKAMKELKINSIDMESSILLLLSSLFNLKSASILSVSDIPLDPKNDFLKSKEIHPDLEKGIDDSIKILINSLPDIKKIIS